MTIRRLQGFGLLISAVGVILGYFGPSATWCHALVWIGIILFILGIPTVHAAQEDGTAGLVGIILLEIGAIISLLIQWNLVSGGALSLISAVASAIGAVMVGWLTTQRKIFPAWAGWAFIVGAVLNLLGGLTGPGSLNMVVSILAVLLIAAALVGYGFPLYRKRRS
jgi:hypothetical protein